MHGYDFDGPNSYALLANYSADGCPATRVYNSTANGSCNNGWSQFWMFHLTEGHTTLEFPQIYSTTLAIQWMRLEEYANHAAGSSLFFLGAMGGEGTPNNTTHGAHQSLWTELNLPSPPNAHSPNHATQNIANATLQFAIGHGLHDH